MIRVQCTNKNCLADYVQGPAQWRDDDGRRGQDSHTFAPFRCGKCGERRIILSDPKYKELECVNSSPASS